MRKSFVMAATLVLVAGLLPRAASAKTVLILSAYAAEGAKLLKAAGGGTEVGTFNGRRFFSGTIGGHDVVLGLVGIGLTNAENTVTAVLNEHFGANEPDAIVFSGVAGGPNIGDVVVPAKWFDGATEYDVDPTMRSVVEGLTLELNPYLPVEDVACIGRPTEPLLTPIRVTEDPILRVGGTGLSSDPYGDFPPPCFPMENSLLACEACGAPPKPTVENLTRFVEDSLPFFDPAFYQGLFEYFENPPGTDYAVVDMETAAVARVAFHAEIPFLAFRAVSDGGGDPNPITEAFGFPLQFFVYQQLAADNAADAVIAFLDAW